MIIAQKINFYFLMIMFLDNDVIWHPPLAAWHRGHTWARPWPLTSPHPAPGWAMTRSVQNFSHIFKAMRLLILGIFCQFYFCFFRLRLGTESDVWREAGGVRTEADQSRACVLSSRRGCVLCPPSTDHSNPPREQHSCTLESVSCDWTCSKF